MAELADAADSKSADRKVMGVRFPLPAPIESISYKNKRIFGCVFLCPNYDQGLNESAHYLFLMRLLLDIQ